MDETTELMTELGVKSRDMQQFLKLNAHITDAEVGRDIADTESEIATMDREEKAYRLLGDRLSMFKAEARRNGINERREFVTTLQDLLKARNESAKLVGGQ